MAFPDHAKNVYKITQKKFKFEKDFDGDGNWD